MLKFAQLGVRGAQLGSSGGGSAAPAPPTGLVAKPE